MDANAKDTKDSVSLEALNERVTALEAVVERKEQQKVPIDEWWDAVDAYVRACGGEPLMQDMLDNPAAQALSRLITPCASCVDGRRTSGKRFFCQSCGSMGWCEPNDPPPPMCVVCFRADVVLSKDGIVDNLEHLKLPSSRPAHMQAGTWRSHLDKICKHQYEKVKSSDAERG